MELSSSKIKKSLLYFQKLNFLASYFSIFQKRTFRAQKTKKPTLKIYFRKWNFLAQSLKAPYIFSKKDSYISGGNLQLPKNKNFLCFEKNTFEESTEARENLCEANTAKIKRKLTLRIK